MRKLLVLALAIGLVLGVASMASASAVTVGYYEDFSYGLNQYTSVQVLNTALWADRTNPFYYGRIGYTFDDRPYNDVLLVRENTRQYMQIQDDAGVFINISTLGYENATFSFKWWTSSAESPGDWAQWGMYVGGADIASMFTNGWTNTNVGSLFDVEGQGRDNEGFHWASIDLPDNTDSIWVYIALNDGNRDYARFDDLTIKGCRIPESQVPIPGAVWLLGSGLVGLAGLKRKYIG